MLIEKAKRGIATPQFRVQVDNVRHHGVTLTRHTLNYALLIVTAFLMAFPFLWMLSTTFKTQSAIFSLPPMLIPDRLFTPDMFSSYERLFAEHNFARYTFNSFYVSLMASIGQLITASLAGFAFARLEFRGKNVLFGLLLATALVPIEVTIIPEFLLAMQVFEPLFNFFGGRWIDTYNPLIVPSFFVGTTGTFLLREFFRTVPRELEEAAVVDGATVFHIYRHVYLPLSLPAMTTLFLLAFINNWNALLRPVIYVKSPELRTLPIALTTFQSEYTAQWDMLLAGSVVTILPLLVVYIFAQRYIVEGISTTGLKG
ncbi:carbohydrate ABC transporter permease [Aggregatilineales bacterium SYSU G02658]